METTKNMLKRIFLISIITVIIAFMTISCGADYIFSPYYKKSDKDNNYTLNVEDQKMLDVNFSIASGYQNGGAGTGKVYRNPSFLGSSYGYLYAFYEYRVAGITNEIGVDGENKCDIQIKKSSAGKSFEFWGTTIGKSATSGTNSHGSPVSFYANNKDLVLLSSSGMGFSTNNNGESKISVSKSLDNGEKWSDWKDIDDSVFNNLKSQGFDRFYSVSGNGITLSDGTIACILDIGSTNNKASSPNKTVKHLGFAILYSTDNGESWKLGGIHKYSTEDSYKNAKIIARTSDKSLLIAASPKTSGQEIKWFKTSSLNSSINEWNEGAKIKSNGGKVEGTKLRGGDRIILTYADETGKLWIATSIDDGKTFDAYKKELYNEMGDESTVRGLMDGTMVFIYGFSISKNVFSYNLSYKRVSVNWLTDGVEDYYVGW